jgi:hypothetical protein
MRTKRELLNPYSLVSLTVFGAENCRAAGVNCPSVLVGLAKVLSTELRTIPTMSNQFTKRSQVTPSKAYLHSAFESVFSLAVTLFAEPTFSHDLRKGFRGYQHYEKLVNHHHLDHKLHQE